MFRDINKVWMERNYLTEAAGGKILNAAGVTVFGYTFNPPTTGRFLLSEVNAAYVFQTSAVALELVSDSASDADAGTGARLVAVTGLDTNYVEVTQLVVPDGVTPVAIPGTFRHVNMVTVLDSGSNFTNVGALTVRTVAGSVLQSFVSATASIPGSSHQALYTVPAGKQFIIHNFFSSGAVITNAAAGARLLPFVRFSGGTFFYGLPQHLTSNAPTMITLPVPFVIPEKTSIGVNIDLVSTANAGIAFGCTGILRSV
jgi:hypothetical protein